MTRELLDTINFPQDLRKLPEASLQDLARELREFIIEIVATKEGHLGASLGVVELTIALHYIFNTPEDLLVWDVGHQAYGHKILTGRKSTFHTNRQLNGISGFPKRTESEFDTFGVGHSSTSISAALGMAIASRLKGDHQKQHIAVIGDASIASGMAFEGLNHAGVTKANLLVILNDNAIGIDPSVGALKEYLTKARVGHKPASDNIIEALNFQYFGPVDGHDLPGLLKVLQEMKEFSGPKFLHVITKKGKGLKKAEEDQVKYHAPGKFEPATGELLKYETEGLPIKFQDVFGLTLGELAEKNDKIIGITPAMPTGSSLKYMMDAFPDRAFDVGIAEQHAVTMAAGLATEGFKPFVAIYSTFLQRAYDQVVHDVALQKLPVRFAIDRAGLVGSDGPTHAGSFDITYLSTLPNFIIMAPSNQNELIRMINTSVLINDRPSAFRYPRGDGEIDNSNLNYNPLEIGKGVIIKEGNEVAILNLGTRMQSCEEAIQLLNSHNIYPTLADARFAKPIDKYLIDKLLDNHKYLITIEEGSSGGFGSSVLNYIHNERRKSTLTKVNNIYFPDRFIDHQSSEDQYKEIGMDADSIANKIIKFYQDNVINFETYNKNIKN